MPVILLIRHGENEYVKSGRLAGRLAGIHLNDKGRQQAASLVELLKNQPVKAVYASPLDRTMETAAPIAFALGLEVIPRSGLLEIDFGEWQDKTIKALRRRTLWKTVQQRPSLMRFPGGETFVEAQGRIVREIEYLGQEYSPKDLVICVAHSDLIKLALAYYQGMPLDMFQRIMIAPASISTIHVSEGGCSIINVNIPPSLDSFMDHTPQKTHQKGGGHTPHPTEH